MTDCTACDPGWYCGSTGLTTPTARISAGYYSSGGSPTATPGASGVVSYGGICPAGFFCGLGTITPQACPAGTFLNTTGGTSQASCLSCTPGFYCASAGLVAPTGSGPCAAGWYCSGGASNPTQFICRAGASCASGAASPASCASGTFTDRTGQAACSVCPAGYICGAGTISPASCPPGYVCAAGTPSLAAAARCLPGSYSASPLLSLLSQCSPCPGGSFCDALGLTAPAGLCAAGYLCTGNNTNALGGSAGPSPVASTLCTVGGWCGAGSAVATPCPLRTYGASAGLSAEANCTLCDSGRYCGSVGLIAPSGACAPGYWCARGNAVPNPTGGAVSLVVRNGSAGNVTIAVGGGLCPAASLCVAGASSPSPCQNGTYWPFPGQGVACATCPAGYWCGLGFTTYNASVCVPGHFCPPATAFATQFPCPRGTYSNASGLQSASQCIPCPAGAYCAGVGNLRPTGLCSAGYVCYGNASTPTPSDNTTGVLCVAGEFCPTGATAVALCAPGQYCTDPLTGLSSGACAGGFYCSGGSWTATPRGELNVYGDAIGDVCPQGHFCPNGTDIPLACPVGTFNNRTGSSGSANCSACVAGWQCDTTGLPLPVHRCDAAYYCPTATVTVRRAGESAGGVNPGCGGIPEPLLPTHPHHPVLQSTFLCTPGSFCAGGNAAPVPCSAGTYANVSGLAACLACPPNVYCPAATSLPLSCPAGYACPGASATGLEHPCPSGTFSALTGLGSLSQCSPCSAGMWCGSAGLTAPTGGCAAGYFCTGGSNTSTPTAGTLAGYTCGTLSGAGLGCPPYLNRTSNSSYPASSLYVSAAAAPVGVGDVCPLGHFCVASSSHPSPCRPGTFANTTGTTSAAACLPCPAGLICPTSGIVTPSMPCPATQFCAGGANASGTACPSGSRCTGGNAAPEACPVGTYQPSAAAAACLPCPASMFCGAPAGTVTPAPCPAGYACGSNSTLATAAACPIGSYSTVAGLSSISQCTVCPPGVFCAAPALTAPSGNCSAGYLCYGNASTATPTDGRSGAVCPAGSFCPSGSSAATPCPPGSFGNLTGRTSVAGCMACPAALTCPTAGLVQPSRPCDAGFACAGGVAAVTAAMLCPPGAWEKGGW